MVGLGVALYFLPFLNGLVGGFVGGFRAGKRHEALVGAVLAAFALAGFTLVFRAGFIAPIWDLSARSSLPVLPVLNGAGVLIGALGGTRWRRAAR
jgi:hypothetical protein